MRVNKIMENANPYVLVVVWTIFVEHCYRFIARFISNSHLWPPARQGDPYVLYQDIIIAIGAFFAYTQLRDTRKSVKSQAYLDACRLVDDEDFNIAYAMMYANRKAFESVDVARLGMSGIPEEVRNAALFVLYRVEKLAVFTHTDTVDQKEMVRYAGDIIINTAVILQYVIEHFQYLDSSDSSNSKKSRNSNNDMLFSGTMRLGSPQNSEKIAR